MVCNHRENIMNRNQFHSTYNNNNSNNENAEYLKLLNKLLALVLDDNGFYNKVSISSIPIKYRSLLMV